MEKASRMDERLFLRLHRLPQFFLLPSNHEDCSDDNNRGKSKHNRWRHMNQWPM